MIQFAIGALTVMAADCNEQSVISSLQSAHIAEYTLIRLEFIRKNATHRLSIMSLNALDRPPYPPIST